MNQPPSKIDDLATIPKQVWEQFVENGGLDAFETLDFLAPIKNDPLDAENAQQIVDQQRHRFKRLITNLFPAGEVERFILERIAHGNLPLITPYDMNQKFSHVFRDMISAKSEGNPVEAFDLEADRTTTRYAHGLYNKKEDLFSIRMLKLRPAVALSILFFRKYLVEFGVLLNRIAQQTLPEHWQGTIKFFTDSWNQNTFIRVLYPAICLHLYHQIDQSIESVECPELNQDLARDTCNWMVINNGFKGKANRQQHGHDSNMNCAATGFLVDGIGKRGWLTAVFDEVIKQRNDQLMVTDLKRIDNHANVLLKLIN